MSSLRVKKRDSEQFVVPEPSMFTLLGPLNEFKELNIYIDPPSTIYIPEIPTIRDHIPLYLGTRRLLVDRHYEYIFLEPSNSLLLGNLDFWGYI